MEQNNRHSERMQLSSVLANLIIYCHIPFNDIESPLLYTESDDSSGLVSCIAGRFNDPVSRGYPSR